MKLLKIGMLNTPEERWLDSLFVFEKVTIVRMFKEKNVPGLDSVDINFSLIQNIIRFFFNRTKKYRFLNPLTRFLIALLRVLSKNKFIFLKSEKYDEIHISYNDFDDSSLLFLLMRPYLNKGIRITRAYKEMRSNYDYMEKMSFLYSDRIVFTSQLSQAFLEDKYGKIFQNKEVLYDLDEDYRGYELANSINYSEKLSSKDNKIHAVILAGRVLSDPNDKRSGSRLYYIELIKQLLDCGIVVHLQAKKIQDFNGYNPYVELAKNNNYFLIEHDIDFAKDIKESYKLLSRYDIGILHAHFNNKSSFEFDKINIPNRYYEYELAHVVPVEFFGMNEVLELKAKENHMVFINNLSELSLDNLKSVVWENRTFKYYIETLYGTNSK